MLDEPKIVQSTAQKAAVIHLTIPRNKIQEEMGPGHNELMSTLKAQGISPAGPWFSHHLRMDPAVFDFEIGVPVTKDVKPTGRVKEVLEVTRLVSCIPTFEDEAKALASFK